MGSISVLWIFHQFLRWIIEFESSERFGTGSPFWSKEHFQGLEAPIKWTIFTFFPNLEIQINFRHESSEWWFLSNVDKNKSVAVFYLSKTLTAYMLEDSYMLQLQPCCIKMVDVFECRCRPSLRNMSWVNLDHRHQMIPQWLRGSLFSKKK